MKKHHSLAIIILVTLMAFTSSACILSEFGLTDNTPKLMNIKAKRADKNDFFMVGTLEVAEGEEVVITSGLSKGKIRVELLEMAGEQNIDTLPEIEEEATFAAEVSGSEIISERVPEGDYLLNAICLERATGNVRIEVQAVDSPE